MKLSTKKKLLGKFFKNKSSKVSKLEKTNDLVAEDPPTAETPEEARETDGMATKPDFHDNREGIVYETLEDAELRNVDEMPEHAPSNSNSGWMGEILENMTSICAPVPTKFDDGVDELSTPANESKDNIPEEKSQEPEPKQKEELDCGAELIVLLEPEVESRGEPLSETKEDSPVLNPSAEEALVPLGTEAESRGEPLSETKEDSPVLNPSAEGALVPLGTVAESRGEPLSETKEDSPVLNPSAEEAPADPTEAGTSLSNWSCFNPCEPLPSTDDLELKEEDTYKPVQEEDEANKTAEPLKEELKIIKVKVEPVEAPPRIITGKIYKESKKTKMGLSLKNSTMLAGVFIANIKKKSLFSKTDLKDGMKVLTIQGQPCPDILEDAVSMLRKTVGDLKIVAEKPRCEI
jgi:hypothetical protein